MDRRRLHPILPGPGRRLGPGDLALQVAIQRALELRDRPGKEEMLEIAERWRPWRGVAARLLWAYYAALKQQRTAVPV